MFTESKKCLAVSLSVLILSACGGGGGGASSSPSTQGGQTPAPTPTPTPAPTPSTSQWQSGVFPAASEFIAKCAVPRTTTDIDGNPYPDTQGSLFDEQMWLRSWSNDTYLWYDEIEDQDPANYATAQAYFDILKTNETTASGSEKDNFHFFQSTEEYESFSQSGSSTDYGIEWVFLRSSPPRNIIAGVVQPNSPAALAGIERGDKLLQIDAESAIDGGNVDFLNSALFPSEEGQSYNFLVEKVDGSELNANLTSTTTVQSFVNNVQVVDTDAGKVGYMRFDGFQRPGQGPLIDGFQQFVDENVTDLVLDLRYNGGGLIAMSSQLAYMIAGPAQTTDRVYTLTQFNSKSATTNPVTGDTIRATPFYNREIDWDAGQFTDNILPSLNLTRVFVITTDGTCSASESLINGLRGIDVEVIQIGGTTCGKPYGFYPTDNCGTTYFTIQFQSVNAKGFGEYAEGFSPVASPAFEDQLPGCTVADDYTTALGDPSEDMFATALERLTTGNCPSVAGKSIEVNNRATNDEFSVFDTRFRSFIRENGIDTPIAEPGAQ